MYVCFSCLVGVVLLVKDCRMINLIMEYLVKDNKRRAFWSLNEDILKITILEIITPYPSRKMWRIRACTHQRPQRNEEQYAISRRTQYTKVNLDNSTNNVMIPLDSWTSGLLVYQSPLSGRKAHLLEDMQIPSVGVFDEVYLAFGRHLEEIHVTWAHLEKKQTRLRTNTKTLKDLCSQRLETASLTLHDAVTTHLVMASQHFMTASARTDSHADLEYSTHEGDRCAREDNGWRCSWEWRFPPRSRALSDYHRLDSLVCDISQRNGSSDGWDWLLNSGNAFTVKHLSKMIDGITLGGNNLGKMHQWNPLIPRKINIFVWRLALNRLAQLTNLDDRGLDIPSVLCPICNDAPESVNHLFLHCSKVKLVWFKCLSWWGVSTVIHNMSVKEVVKEEHHSELEVLGE
ncbi:RNA-directed DNA polymerase, eukaryota, reverse transcriptase zinc-binding domain protein [Tanacetum coccineum]